MLNKKLKAEPVYIINGKKTDKPFHDQMLASPAGENASNLAAVRFAIKNGWTLYDAVNQFVSSPALRLTLLSSKSSLEV